MIKNIRHTGLVIRDISKSLKFYEGLLGLSVLEREVESSPYIEKVVGIKGVKLEWVKLKANDGNLVELIQYHYPINTELKVVNKDSNDLGCSHIAFTIENIEELFKKLCEQGYHCNNKPQLCPDGSVKVLYCHDPDGIVLEFVEELKSG